MIHSRFVLFLFALLLILFEWANIYFIMPLPGSQESNSINLAYFLYHYRWIFRLSLIIGIILSFTSAWKWNKWLVILIIILTVLCEYVVDKKMSADHMFLQPKNLVFKKPDQSEVDENRIIMGIEINGEAKAYPIQYLGYHHQVIDFVGGKKVMITYCTVCRTGRIYEPIVDGKEETFRLVGMDHYNAMFEDSRTKSWWRQVSGEAIAGKLKGKKLPEIPMQQLELKKWIALYPETEIMQPDSMFKIKYDSMSIFEAGKYYGRLTKKDTISGNPKSWVLWLKGDKESKMVDWNLLVKNKIIKGKLDYKPYFLILCDDLKSFAAFYSEVDHTDIQINGDTIYYSNSAYRLDGRPFNLNNTVLKRIPVYQENLHTVNTFHPE